MLILARRTGEAFIINNDIRVVYLGHNRYGQAKFGIEAPYYLSIHREEIQKKIDAEKKEQEKLFHYCKD